MLDYIFGFDMDNWFDHVGARHKELGPIFREQVVRGNLHFCKKKNDYLSGAFIFKDILAVVFSNLLKMPCNTWSFFILFVTGTSLQLHIFF